MLSKSTIKGEQSKVELSIARFDAVTSNFRSDSKTDLKKIMVKIIGVWRIIFPKKDCVIDIISLDCVFYWLT